MLTILLCTNMEKYAKYHSCNNTEKYVNVVRISYADRIYREIHVCKHNLHISFAQNIKRNTQIVLVYFTHMEYLEKYTNCYGVFYTDRILREICDLCWCISLAGNL